MNYKKVLEKIGMIEGEDFSLTETSFTMLPKTRRVETSPSVLDEQGNIVAEAIFTNEQYVPEAPVQAILDNAWELVQIDEVGIEGLIDAYLADKVELRDFEYDNLHINSGQIFNWDFKQIPQPTQTQLVALIPQVNAKRSKESKIELGKKARAVCTNCLDLIAGHNLELNLSAEQITQMQTTFANIQSALMTNRPSTAKFLISNLTPDGVIITEAFKAEVLAELVEF